MADGLVENGVLYTTNIKDMVIVETSVINDDGLWVSFKNSGIKIKFFW